MTNSEIADKLKWIADLSELHGGNAFKIRTYGAAAFRIDKLQIPLAEKSLAELESIEGVGKSIASKIHELNTTGTISELDDLLEDTPAGVLELFKVKGIGPKKIAYIWQDLGIESVGELLYACKENRLAQAKGFGAKTQDSIRKNIEFMFANANRFHYANLERTANQLLPFLRQLNLCTQLELTGPIRRKCEILDSIDLIGAASDEASVLRQFADLDFMKEAKVEGNILQAKINGMIPLNLTITKPEQFASMWFRSTATQEHLEHIAQINVTATSESEIYAANGMDFIEPELREGGQEIQLAKAHQLPKLIEESDLKGILHNHSTWSDGANTLEQMATYCKSLGYEYLGMYDHSKSAFYANGLNEERIMQQHAEIDALNLKLAPFRIFKGIESDILYDGSLDYSDDVLRSFDFIVASVHSNLKMTEEKAMARLIAAIENPHTTILGHPTGRLLLMREGYPVDHRKMIDACAANGVIIELNANPYRLDLDWRWINYAMEKNVRLSINPDAHETEGFHDMHFGTCVARKGILTREYCLNAMNLSEIEAYFIQRKPA